MGEPDLVEGDDRGGLINIFDCIKDSMMDRVGRNNGVISRRSDLECTDRGVTIVINSCSRRMFDTMLLDLTLRVAIFDAIAGVEKLLRVRRTYVVRSTRFYLRVDNL